MKWKQSVRDGTLRSKGSELAWNIIIQSGMTGRPAEIIAVAAFYEAVEKAYESGIAGEKLMEAYRGFKKVVPSMAEEKTLCKEFEEASGYV